MMNIMKFLLALLIALVAVNFYIVKNTPVLKNKETVISKTRLKGLIIALEAYKKDTGSYPSSKLGLNALSRNFDVLNWQGPYINREKAFYDEWQQPFVYRNPANCSVKNQAYLLYSMGKNSIDDCQKGDDIYVN